MPRPSARRVPPDRAELEGFREGLSARALTFRREGRPQVDVERLLRDAGTALAADRVPVAESLLLDAERRMAELDPEVELLEYPRGLVGYTPKGERGVPPGRDEEPLSNRLLLVQRLLAVRKSAGRSVGPLVERLNAAEQAYRAGDRATARRLVDEVHAALEVDGDAPASREASNRGAGSPPG